MRVFTFPDPALHGIRGFVPQAIQFDGSRPSELAYIDVSGAVGQTLTVCGNCSALDGPSSPEIRIDTDGGDLIGEIDATGAFSFAVTLTALATRVYLLPYPTGTIASFGALTADVA